MGAKLETSFHMLYHVSSVDVILILWFIHVKGNMSKVLLLYLPS